MLSNLKPDSATTVGLLTAAGVYMIYNQALPNQADIASSMPHDATVEKCRRGAAIKSAALIAVVFLVAKDLNSYMISGAALIGIDYMYKHANGTHPATGKLDTSTGADTVAPGLVQAYPMPDYTDDTGTG